MNTPDSYTFRVQQAAALVQQGNPDDALALLYSVVTAAPDHREAWWLIAQIAPRHDQRQQALQRVLAIDPAYAPARELAARWQEQAAPPESPPILNAPSQPDPFAAPPELSPDVRSHPDPFAAPVRTPPAPDYVSHPDPFATPEPGKPKRQEEGHPQPAGRLQPFLILNGGCASGCFATLLTLLVFGLLAFLILRGSVSAALRSVGTLAPGQTAPASLIPAMMLTAVLHLLRTTPLTLPFNLSGLIPGLDPALLPQLPTSAQMFSQAMGGVWQALGYPPQTGDLIVGQMQTVGPQIEDLSWILPLLFFGAWMALAFVFVFMRARSGRFIHWALATMGLWLLGGAAYGLAIVIYRTFGGGN